MPRPLKESLKFGEAFSGIQAIWNRFDPIGVSNEVDDEYNAYVTPILDGLVSGEGANEIANYYEHVVTRWMGLGCPRENAEEFGTAVKTWWDNSLDDLMND